MRNITLSLLFIFLMWPNHSKASIFSDITDKVKSFITKSDNVDQEATKSSQTMDVLKPTVVDSSDINGAVEEEISSTTDSLSAVNGSLRISTEDLDIPTNDQINVYEVKKGDTLSTVAKLFGVSKNTIIWANDLKSNTLTPGDTLVILPITGIKHVVKKGDTVSSIAKKYKADADDIAKFNGIVKDSKLAVGDTILVPAGEITVVSTTGTGKPKTTSKLLDKYTTSAPSGFLIRPITGGRKTQGLHGHNGVDLAAPLGTPVMASGDGRVILAKMGGYNGGYGNMIIIMHEGNIQTVYAHLSNIYVSAGQQVSQGEVIGALGNTGHSTGPHLHFEVRGARNPF